jgi:hypothetical protein
VISVFLDRKEPYLLGIDEDQLVGLGLIVEGMLRSLVLLDPRSPSGLYVRAHCVLGDAVGELQVVREGGAKREPRHEGSNV